MWSGSTAACVIWKRSVTNGAAVGPSFALWFWPSIAGFESMLNPRKSEPAKRLENQEKPPHSAGDKQLKLSRSARSLDFHEGFLSAVVYTSLFTTEVAVSPLPGRGRPAAT